MNKYSKQSLFAIDSSGALKLNAKRKPKKIIIPPQINGIRVKSIGSYAFHGHTELLSIVIPEGVTDIEEGAFYNCSGLTNVRLPGSLLRIGADAFYGCRSLKFVSLPENILVIERGAFKKCGLSSLSLPKSLKKLGGSVIDGCPKIKEIIFNGDAPVVYDYYGNEHNVIYFNIPRPEKFVVRCNRNAEGFTNPWHGVFTAPIGEEYKIFKDKAYTINNQGGIIGYKAEEEQPESVNIPETIAEIPVRAIGRRVFSGLSELREAHIPDGVQTIGIRAFYKCGNLISADLPDSIEKIEAEAFSMCRNLTRIGIPENIVSVGDSAFEKCALEAIEFPKSLKFLGNEAFDNCSRLKRIIFEGDAPAGLSGKRDAGDSLGNNLTPYFVTYFNKNSKGFSENWRGYPAVTVGTNYEIVSDGNFYVNSQGVLIKFIEELYYSYEIAVPEQINGIRITKIGDYAFKDCGLIVSVILPDTVTSLGTEAFHRCANLKNVKMPKGLKIIGEKAFGGCSSLDQIELPESITDIGCEAFIGCCALKSITIPHNLKRLGCGAFDICQSLKEIRFEGDAPAVISLKQNGYEETNSIARYVRADIELRYNKGARGFKDLWHERYPVPFGEEYKTIFEAPYLVNNKGAILGVCRDTGSKVRIPKKIAGVPIRIIGARAFYGCLELEQVTLREGIEIIDDSAFESCYNLRYITLPKSLVSINNRAFWECYNLSAIVIQNNTKKIGNYAFLDCYHLSDIKIPDNIISVGTRAFENCRSLKSVVFPGTLKFLGDDVFDECWSLRDIYFEGNAPTDGAGLGLLLGDFTVFYNKTASGFDNPWRGYRTKMRE